MNTEKYLIKCLTVDEAILRHPKLKTDYAMRFILGYIVFRLNLEEIEWTFSQSEIERQLNMPQKMVNRRCRKLIDWGILICGDSIKTKTGEYVSMSVNVESLESFLKGGPSQGDLAGGMLSQGDSAGSVKVTYQSSHGDWYNKDKEKKDASKKKDEAKQKGSREDLASTFDEIFDGYSDALEKAPQLSNQDSNGQKATAVQSINILPNGSEAAEEAPKNTGNKANGSLQQYSESKYPTESSRLDAGRSVAVPAATGGKANAVAAERETRLQRDLAKLESQRDQMTPELFESMRQAIVRTSLSA
jgi:hypothetical protein